MSGSMGGAAPAGRRPRLPALSGVRIFAAVHIYLFHLMQAHEGGLLQFGLLEGLPGPVARLLGRGYISTGFFFQLSGFLLAYVYLGRDGRLRSSPGAFLRGRFLRLYPLYFLSLVLLIPAPSLLPFMSKNPPPSEVAAGVATSLTLTQAWFPRLALWWNAPAWALSAFAAFYLILPGFARAAAGLGRRSLVILAVGLAFAAWIPPGLYFAFDPAGNAWTAGANTLGSDWLNVLRFNPLTWLPQFLSGVALGRFFAGEFDSGRVTPSESGPLRPSLGDAVTLGVLLLVSTSSTVPYVALRHGLLAPASLLVIADLARGRGWLARFLSWPGFGQLSETSFALFALQQPAGLWFCVAFVRSPQGSTAQLLGIISFTLATAMLLAEVVQRQFLERIRARSSDRRAGPNGPRPHLQDAGRMDDRARTSRAAD